MRLLTYSLATLALVALPCIALAQQEPGIPEAFHGSANGTIGTSITASINGVIVASTTIEAGGVYGYPPHLFFIPDPDGARAGTTVSFSVGSAALGSAIFANGAITALDLLSLASGTTTASSLPAASPSIATTSGMTDAAVQPQPRMQPRAPYQYHIAGNHRVGSADLAYLLGHWGLAGVNTPADINGDGIVDLTDFTLLLSHWSI